MDTKAGAAEFNYSGACNHCNDPACVHACPTGAMHIAPDGTVIHDDNRCIGCARCVHSCPYGAVSINEATGYAQKCDACAALRVEGKDPACALACITRALHFARIADLEREYGPGIHGTASFLPDASQTRPSTIIAHVPKELSLAETNCQILSTEVQEKDYSFHDTNETIAVLGGGPAAVTAVQEFRKSNRTAKMIMFALEKELPYCRPLLSKALLHGFSTAAYRMIDDQWIQENRVELKLGNPVLQIDTENHCVIPKDGAVTFYDKCIYALGADCFVPPIPGVGMAGVLTVRKLQDLDKVRRACLTAKYATVIGGGFVGLETAWQLQKAGLCVTIVEVSGALMGQLVDKKTAQVLQENIQTAGIDVITGIGIQRVEGTDRAERICLADGREVPADLVIISTGVRANTALAKAAGLEVGHAVIVNEHMETSAPDVYACGDCCEYQGMNRATWVESITQGRIAGARAAGCETTYQSKPSSIVVHTAGASLYAIGDMGKNVNDAHRFLTGELPERTNNVRVNETHSVKRTHFTACILNEILVGMCIVGDLSYLGLARDAVNNSLRREDFLRLWKERGASVNEA